MISLIERESEKTFDDLKSLRFQHMTQILQNVNSNNFGNHYNSYGINNYYYVYEKMIDHAFGNISNKQSYYPHGIWHVDNKIFNASALIPDTLLIKDNITYIIDAKMYKYAIKYNRELLPSTQSIQKQITYGDYLYYVKNIQNIRNIFILPMDKMETDQENLNNMNYIAYAVGDWRNIMDMKDYDYIFTFSIDLNFLLNNYKKNLTIYIEWMCNEITVHLNYIKQ